MTEIKLKQKVSWREALVIDIPFFPFQSYNKTESKILDYVANRVLQIARDEKRIKFCEGDFSWLKDRHFTQSPSIVGIDIANITTDNIGYLDYVFQITRVHPCLLINCSIEEDELKGTRLHHDLKKAGYVLPVFSRIPASDIVSSRQRFGNDFVELLMGKKDYILIKDIPSLKANFSKEDLSNRFPGVFFKSGRIFHRPKIIWLGIESTNISKGLSYLFNVNKKTFDPSWFYNKFKVDSEEFKSFLMPSMLFAQANDKINVKFRLIKGLIYPKLMHSLMHQFDSNLIEAGAIDTTHGSYPGYAKGNVVEYHSIGKIFDSKDTFACKLLCYIRSCLNSKKFKKIILVDNGKENGLYELLPKIFGIETNNLIRIVNYFNEPILYPFDKFERGENAVVITDVINTGSFINKVCKLLQDNEIQIDSIFAFIINVTTPRKNILKDISGSKNINIFNYIEKKLNDIDEVRKPDHLKRFGISSDTFGETDEKIKKNRNRNEFSNRESFLAFWNTANSFCTVKRAYNNCDVTISLPEGLSRSITSACCHEIDLLDNAFEKIKTHDQLFMFLKFLLKKKQFSAVFVNDNKNFEGWSNLIKTVVPTINVYNATEKNIKIDTTISQENILIVYTALNIGRTIKETIQKVKKLFDCDVRITCLTLFSRRNAISGTTQISNQSLDELIANGISMYCFYFSALPYYLFETNNGYHKYVDNTLETIVS